MSFQNYWLFLPACFALNMAFGPNNVLSLSNGARDGMRYSILAAFGRLLAFAAMIAMMDRARMNVMRSCFTEGVPLLLVPDGSVNPGCSLSA